MNDTENEVDEVLAMLRDTASAYLMKRTDPLADGAQWAEMAEMGWLGLGLPEACGGSGLGVAGATVLAELFGRSLLPAPFISCACMPSELLAGADAASGASLQAVADLIGDGGARVTLAWQESVGQIEALPPATQLRAGVVSGRKLFVPAAFDDGILLVSAAQDGVPVLVAVSASAPGVSVVRAEAGLGSYASVSFDAAPILYGAPLLEGEAAQEALRRALAAGRIALSAQLAGMAAACLEKTIEYVGQRIQFGHPIAAFQSIRHRCVDLHIDTLLAAASWRHALAAYRTAPALASTEAAISAAKARCGDVAIKVARQAVQMHGAMGFAEESGVGAYLRAALHSAAHLGGPSAHRRRFARLHTETEQNHG